MRVQTDLSPTPGKTTFKKPSFILQNFTQNVKIWPLADRRSITHQIQAFHGFSCNIVFHSESETTNS